MKPKPRLEDWEESKLTNQKLIIANKMQIKMAERIVTLCDEEIAKLKTKDLNNSTASS